MGSDPLLDELARWAAEARVDEAARARARERWLRHQAGEEESFADLLVDLAERGASVGLRSLAGRWHRGVVVAVGLDFCALRDASERVVLLPLESVTSLATDAGRAPALDRRAGNIDLRFVEALSSWAGDRPRVQVVPVGAADPVSGELTAVGDDVLSLRLDGAGGTVYLRLAAVTEVTVVTTP